MVWANLRTELTRWRPHHPYCSLDPLAQPFACTSVRPHRQDITPASARGRGNPSRAGPSTEDVSQFVLSHHPHTHLQRGLGDMWAMALLPHGTHWGTGMAQQHSKRRALCLDPVCGFPPTSSQASDPFPATKEHWKKDGTPPQRQKDRNHGKKTDLKFPLPPARWPLGNNPLCLCVTAK